MPRAIDHLVIPTRDLAALAELYRRLGFLVGARNRHPWGTQNHIVQFDGAFLELIGLGADFHRPEGGSAVAPFAGFIADFLESREGLAMLVLRSSDAEADRQSFAAKGLGDFARFDFGRKARRPDGSEVDVAFSLAFAASEQWPETGFFVCENRFPENFWSRQAQVHPNGAIGVSGLAFAHEHPADATAFLETFLDSRAISATGGGALLEIDGAAVEIAQRGVHARRYGASLVAQTNPFLGARIRVADLAVARRCLEDGKVRFSAKAGLLIVAPEDAAGAGWVFEAA